MFNFDFYNPTHIVFGKDRLDELDILVPKDERYLSHMVVAPLYAVVLLTVLLRLLVIVR